MYSLLYAFRFNANPGFLRFKDFSNDFYPFQGLNFLKDLTVLKQVLMFFCKFLTTVLTVMRTFSMEQNVGKKVGDECQEIQVPDAPENSFKKPIQNS